MYWETLTASFWQVIWCNFVQASAIRIFEATCRLAAVMAAIARPRPAYLLCWRRPGCRNPCSRNRSAAEFYIIFVVVSVTSRSQEPACLPCLNLSLREDHGKRLHLAL